MTFGGSQLLGRCAGGGRADTEGGDKPVFPLAGRRGAWHVVGWHGLGGSCEKCRPQPHLPESLGLHAGGTLLESIPGTLLMYLAERPLVLI